MFSGKRKKMILSFSGLDGAGKSTQIDHLRSWLTQQGYNTTVLWARGGYTPGFEWLKKFIRLLLRNKIPLPGNSISRDKQLSRPFIAKLWLSIAILDLMMYWGIYLRFQLLVGNVVICDRFLDDTRLDFSRNFPQISFDKLILWKMLCFVIPKADRYFLLWVPVSESIRRGKLKDEPFPDDSDTLEWRLSSYLNEKYFPSNLYVKLNCTEAIEDVSNKIVSDVQSVLDKRS